MVWQTRSTDPENTEKIGELLGSLITPPEVIELRSDLGGGKTTLVRGLVRGLGGTDKVSSPTFTLNKIYDVKRLQVHHFDFYRLDVPGILSSQLEESLNNPKVVTAVEWADMVDYVLPTERITVELKPVPDNEYEREITFEYPQSRIQVIEKLRNKLAESES